MRRRIIIMVLTAVIIAIGIAILISSFSGVFDKITDSCTEEAKVCPDGSVVERVGPDCEFEECSSELERFYCDESSREADVCIEIYEPVCGWFNSSKVNCVDYPCAVDFSNSCFACQNSDIEYFTKGTCPYNLIEE